MKIGILADIHGHVHNLKAALARLEAEAVDEVVLLGDVIESARNACETVALLRSCRAVGVWGNHELGLCVDPDPQLRATYTEPVVDFFGTLKSRFEIDDLLFCHGLPSHDPTDPTSYYLGPRPDAERALDDSFASFPHRIMFVGHFHRWFAATPYVRFDWDGAAPIQFRAGERYLVIVHALLSGYFAIFDASKQQLTPWRTS